MKKNLFPLLAGILFTTSIFAQIKGLLISELLTNPNGNDSPYEYIELLATANINFATTPYIIVVTDNGTANSNGWRAGGAITYAFQINTGSVTAGQVVYVISIWYSRINSSTLYNLCTWNYWRKCVWREPT